MVFFFGGASKPKGPAELCRVTKQSLQKLAQTNDKIQAEQLDDEIARYVEEMRITLAGPREHAVTNQQQHRLVVSMCDEDLFRFFAAVMHRITFERRKVASAVLAAAVRFKSDDPRESDPAVVPRRIIQEHPDAVIMTCRGYEHRGCAITAGAILQEMLKFDSLVAVILYHEPGHDNRTLRDVNPNAPTSGNGMFWKFFRYIDRGSFEASASAFEMLRQLLINHRSLLQHYLRVNAPLFFQRYHTILMQSASYVTKRQSIKLLADILLDRTHFDLMSGYVKDPENLKLAMTLLRDGRRMVAYEAFHIFKIFAADPEKSYGVLKILILNKERLEQFFTQFMVEREEEGQFGDEKAYCLNVVRTLPTEVPPRENPNLMTLRPDSYRRSQRALAL